MQSNAPQGCAVRGEEVYALHTARAQSAGKRLFDFSRIGGNTKGNTCTNRQLVGFFFYETNQSVEK